MIERHNNHDQTPQYIYGFDPGGIYFIHPNGCSVSEGNKSQYYGEIFPLPIFNFSKKKPSRFWRDGFQDLTQRI
jgi:hypothetical protein